jgi:hypothetical protein
MLVRPMEIKAKSNGPLFWLLLLLLHLAIACEPCAADARVFVRAIVSESERNPMCDLFLVDVVVLFATDTYPTHTSTTPERPRMYCRRYSFRPPSHGPVTTTDDDLQLVRGQCPPMMVQNDVLRVVVPRQSFPID